MNSLLCEIRPGAYYDSIVLMQLQRALASLEGVLDAGVVMGTPANQALLAEADLLAEGVEDADVEDLVIVVRARSEQAANEALRQVDDLLKRRPTAAPGVYRPRSLAAALSSHPHAGWVLVSVPGRYAAEVAREALDADRHVFLYSDNVPLEDEVALKDLATAKGLLLMGPDCGTAIINGVGLGFANQISPGLVGLVGASGTGLQTIASSLQARGVGVSQAIGTGGRDLAPQVGGRTTLQALDLLARDPDTRVIVLVSKPPEPEVAARVLGAAYWAGKPVVVNFIGLPQPAQSLPNPPLESGHGGLYFAPTLSQAAARAQNLLSAAEEHDPHPGPSSDPILGHARGLFSGGTLAYQTLVGLQAVVQPLFSNLTLPGVALLEDPARSEGHTILDLGADEYTVGRLHPMIDNDLRLRRLRQEWQDPHTGLILLDVVLGEGAHPDPSAEIAPVLVELLAGRDLEVVIMLVGTDLDPQGADYQRQALTEAGAHVFLDPDHALAHLAHRLIPMPDGQVVPVTLPQRDQGVSVINVGLESFHASLTAQGAEAVQVDWRPPARGDQRLLDILQKMKG